MISMFKNASLVDCVVIGSDSSGVRMYLVEAPGIICASTTARYDARRTAVPGRLPPRPIPQPRTYQSERTTGLQLSTLAADATIGAVQRWWLEYEKLEARRDTFNSIFTYFNAQDTLKEQFPACISSSDESSDTKGTDAR